MNFAAKSATVTFDENVISAQELSRAMSGSPHMMGASMQYGGYLLLKVEGVKKSTTGKKATTTLRKLKGVAQAVVYPTQEAVAVQFAGKERLTTQKLLDTLNGAGLKASLYGSGASRPTTKGL